MSRSFLFIPGNTPSMIQNADVFESDAIIIDLEDSVLLNDKDAARILVSEFLRKYELKNTDIYIRTNDAESPHFDEDISTPRYLWNGRGSVTPVFVSLDLSRQIG